MASARQIRQGLLLPESGICSCLSHLLLHPWSLTRKGLHSVSSAPFQRLQQEAWACPQTYAFTSTGFKCFCQLVAKT